jgi:SAM-dependent methyltransferase
VLRGVKRSVLTAWRLARRAAVTLPRVVACNLCGWQGRRFIDDGWHPRSMCPACQSRLRHRLLVAALDHLERFSWSRLVDGRRVLHVAPEETLGRLLRRRAARYVTADALAPGVDLRVDLCAMGQVPDGSFDLALVCDVLEHVRDDVTALRELHRVLAPGGVAVLTVPQPDGLATTREGHAAMTPAERLRAFGQEDHVRIHGQDFPARVTSAGFRVTVVDDADFAPRTVERHVLYNHTRSPHPLATNRRRVFFAARV